MPMADQRCMHCLRSLALLLFLPLGACLEMEQTITVEADGSGKQTMKMAMRETTLTDITRTSAAAELGAAPNPRAVFDKELVGTGPIERQNPARIAKAHHQLGINLNGPKLRTALGLSVKVNSKTSKTKGAKPA